MVHTCIPSPWRQKQEDCILKANQGYIVSFRPPWALDDILSQKQNMVYLSMSQTSRFREETWANSGLM